MAGLGKNIATEFTLWAKMSGYTYFNRQFYPLWYFGEGIVSKGFMNDRYLPSKHIETIEGKRLRIDFYNYSSMLHTVHLHGMDVDQLNDGVPMTSFAIEPDQWHTYECKAPHAGTYHYHCHADTVVHYHRGMSGTVIVRPPDGSTNLAWEGGPTFDEEVLWHLHTYDSDWRTATASSELTARHRPDLFLLNGLQTLHAHTDPFTVVNVSVGETAYIRLVNCSYQWGRVRLGGLPFQVVASDGRPMRQVPTTDTWEIGPGERYDLLFEATKPTAVDATVEYLDDYSGDVLGQAATQMTVT